MTDSETSEGSRFETSFDAENFATCDLFIEVARLAIVADSIGKPWTVPFTVGFDPVLGSGIHASYGIREHSRQEAMSALVWAKVSWTGTVALESAHEEHGAEEVAA